MTNPPAGLRDASAATATDDAAADNSRTDPDDSTLSATSSSSPSPPLQPLHPGTVLRSQRATKIQVDANLTRDLGIFVAFVAVMTLLTLTALSGVGHADDELVKKRIERVQNGGSKKRMSPGERFVENFAAWTKILPHLADRAQLPGEEDRCNLYLAGTSIPDAGFGLFAGKSIGEGSTVVDAGMLLPIGSSTMAQHQLIIKPHPTASNVVLAKKPDGHAYFVAKRNIEPGEEIFVDMPTGDDSASYYSLFASVPTPASYALADEILTNEFKDLTRKKSKFVDRKSKVFHPGRKNKEAQTTGATVQVDVQSLIVIRNVVKRFDPLASSLLPVTSSRLGLSMVLGAGLAALNNRTIHSIHQKGQCFDGGITTATAEGGMEDTIESKGPVLTRNVAEGDVIMSLPLYIVTPETSGDFASSCLKIGNVSLLFCPLSRAHASIKHSPSKNKPAVSEEDECANCPNAQYAWSSWNPSKDIVSGMGIERASKEYPVGLSLDIIATRDISRGEEILLDSASLEQAVVEEDTASTNKIKTEL